VLIIDGSTARLTAQRLLVHSGSWKISIPARGRRARKGNKNFYQVSEMKDKSPKMLSVIIPCHNEESFVGTCLESLLKQTDAPKNVEIIVVPNGCTDATADKARSYAAAFRERGWTLGVHESPQPGKVPALNFGDTVARGDCLLYLDADILCGLQILGQIADALDTDQPRYATGRLVVAPARSWVSRRYARFWQSLPFMESGAVGAGLFAVNSAGRARWGVFPALISDDTFVRLQFEPSERIQVEEAFLWPIIEGFRNLVRVRKRQDSGVAEIRQIDPALLTREGKAKPDYPALFRKDPIGFCVYSLVSIAVRLTPASGQWTRGR
jgi:glycosyltransferase involved in cell wall biosynthesis